MTAVPCFPAVSPVLLVPAGCQMCTVDILYAWVITFLDTANRPAQACQCVTRRKQHRPGSAQNDNTMLFVFPLCGFSLSLFCNYNTMHVPPARSSADLTKPNHTPTRHIRAKEKIVLQMATPQASSSQRTRIRYCVTRRKLQTPGTATEAITAKKPSIPTFDSVDRLAAHIDPAPDSTANLLCPVSLT